MALEAVIFQQDLFGYNGKDLCNLLGGNWSYDHFGLEKEEVKAGCSVDEHFPDNQTVLLSSSDTTNNFLHGEDYWRTTTNSSPTSMVNNPLHYHHQLHQYPNSSSDATTTTTTTATVANNGSTSGGGGGAGGDPSSTTTCSTRPKRRRSKSRKNKEEIENQRMTHIAVERNRRKQMNEYLSVLRSLMPESYVQRGDQASIIGGAINFVKELEHRLQWLTGQQEVKERLPFSEFFTFPQYSTKADNNPTSMSETMADHHHQQTHQCAVADIEVTMVESHANLKIRSKRKPAQLLKVVAGLSSMRLTILHLNVTTVDQTVLYSLSVKVEDDCKLTSVDDIATAVNQLVGRIQEDA